MKFKCPNCQAKIYSRAHRDCYSCGVALPPELLLPELVIRSTEEKAKRDLKKELEGDNREKIDDTLGGKTGATFYQI